MQGYLKSFIDSFGRLTLGVIKNIIPAVASTNAIIAAACVSEALKVMTSMSQILNNFMMYQGSIGVYTSTFPQEQAECCVVCGTVPKEFTISPTSTLEMLIAELMSDPQLQLKGPSITSSDKSLYMTKPPSLERQLRPNLGKPLKDLFSSGERLNVSDRAVENTFEIIVKFAETSA